MKCGAENGALILDTSASTSRARFGNCGILDRPSIDEEGAKVSRLLGSINLCVLQPLPADALLPDLHKTIVTGRY